MTELRRGPTAAVAGLAVAVACSSVPPPAGQRLSLLDAVARRPSFESPATWHYHPRQPAALRARLDLGAGKALYAGARGERWLVEGQWARAAAITAPEDLVSIARTPEGWLFVGTSGTSYEAPSPLAAFTRSSAPVDRLAVVSGVGDTIVAVRVDGRLVKGTSGGASWASVGPDETFADVAMLRDGSGAGLALAVPEALYRTSDAGETWALLDAPPLGAVSLEATAAGIVIASPLGTSTWTPAGVVDGGAKVRARLELGAKLPRGANAAALSIGAAALIGGRYVEVQRATKSASGWTVLSGPLVGPLVEARLAISARCDLVRVAGFGTVIWVACGRSTGSEAMEVELLRSDDSGKSFASDVGSVAAHPRTFRMAAGPDGALVVTGVCAVPSRGCKARGVLHRRPRVERPSRDVGDASPREADASARGDASNTPAADHELGPSVTPALRDVADAVAFSPDGTAVYAVGRRTKNDALAIYVSRDAGKTFTAREVDRVELPAADDMPLRPWDVRRPDVRVAGLGVSEDGAVSVVLEREGDWHVVLADDSGGVMAVSPGPASGAVIAAVGLRALAVRGATREAWESLDGGASWASIGALPASPCGEDDACSFELACGLPGCVVGDELTRSGWRGQAELDVPGLAPPHAAVEVADRRVRAPLACALDPVPWTRLGVLDGLPDARVAALGDAAWFEAESEPSRASVTTLHGLRGPRPRVERHELLAPLDDAKGYAFTYESQIEGGVALRYPLPSARAEIADVEVAWDDRIQGVIARGRIPRAGAYQPGDYESAGQVARKALPSLLSIAPGGVHVRIHSHARDAQTTWFLDGRRVTSLPPVPWPTGPVDPDFSDVTRVDGAAVPLRVAGRGSVVVRGRPVGSGWAFDAFTVGVVEPDRFGLRQSFRVAYQGRAAGLHVARWSVVGEDATATFHPFVASGVPPAVAVPTPRVTGDRPVPCTAPRRASTPRIVSPHLPGTRHPMIVTDANEPLRVMLTDASVLFGTPTEPCVATFDAVVVPTETHSSDERALVPLDEPERSWLFRWSAEEDGRRVAEYRTMSCRFEPSLEVPAEVFRLPGTMVLRR